MENLEDILVSVIVVNWNGLRYLRSCLASILFQTCKKIEVIVVDNNSTDGSVDFIKKEFPQVRLIRNSKNYGFAKGNNIGIRIARGEYIVTVNNDTELEAGCVQELVRAVNISSDIGMCAAKILLFNHRDLIDSAGMLLYPDGLAICRGHLAADAGNFNTAEEIFLPTACVALYRKEAIVKAGYFDENYFAYCEDTDLGLRIRMLGYKCVYEPRARVYHHYSGTTGQDLSLKIYLSERNRVYTIIKCYSLAGLIESLYHTLIRYILYIYAASFKNLGQIKDFTRKSPRIKIAYILLKTYSCCILNIVILLKKRVNIMRDKDMRHEKIHSLPAKFKMNARTLALERRIYVDQPCL
ncbi:MAG: glycosyltransferase family 2 protein [Candidatus Omnitrophota bacterium]|nr:glycosyltransferase family 2 protein [Candidatus Omnitrophota bacterium]